MSIKIGTSKTSTKNVVDVVVGTSSSTKKNVNFVKDWNGKIIWQRDTRIQLTADNTRFTLNDWSEGSTAGYTIAKPHPYRRLSSEYQIEYYNGTEWIVLKENTHYTVRWENNRVPETGTAEMYVTGTGKMYIEGMGDYGGSFYREFGITWYFYDPPSTFTINTSVSPDGSGSVDGGGPYNEGTTCTLTASASSGYNFSKWSDNTTENPKSFTVTGKASYTAYFTPTTPSISTVEFAGTYCYYGSTSSSGSVYDPAYSNSSVKVTMSDGTTFSFSKNDTGPKSGVSYSLSQGDNIISKYKNGKAISGSTGTITYNAHTIKYSTVKISCDGTTYTGSRTANAYIFYNYANYG